MMKGCLYLTIEGTTLIGTVSRFVIAVIYSQLQYKYTQIHVNTTVSRAPATCLPLVEVVEDFAAEVLLALPLAL